MHAITLKSQTSFISPQRDEQRCTPQQCIEMERRVASSSGTERGHLKMYSYRFQSIGSFSFFIFPWEMRSYVAQRQLAGEWLPVMDKHHDQTGTDMACPSNTRQASNEQQGWKHLYKDIWSWPVDSHLLSCQL